MSLHQSPPPPSAFLSLNNKRDKSFSPLGRIIYLLCYSKFTDEVKHRDSILDITDLQTACALETRLPLDSHSAYSPLLLSSLTVILRPLVSDPRYDKPFPRASQPMCSAQPAFLKREYHGRRKK